MLAIQRARWIIAFIASAVAIFVVGISAQQASAATACYPAFVNGVPAITMTKDAPTEVLFGNDMTVTLKAAEAATETFGGYNLSFRDVIPPGTTYKAGSSPIAPTIIANQPATGYTTLIFSNVSDLAPGSDFSLTYGITQTTSGPSSLAVGDIIRTGDKPPLSVTGAGGAYVNCNPREVPTFSATGVPVVGPTSYSSSVTGITSDTLVTAIKITKSEPSSEHELLRGVHDHQTLYTLKVENNAVASTNSVFVDDYLPSGLEFLGCAPGADNTTNAPTNPGSTDEYPGSGPINAPGNMPAFANPCLDPVTVETVFIDPDGGGPLPTGIYTHVVFDLGGQANFSPAGVFQFQYAAAVPICPNTLDWQGPAPPTAGPNAPQIANLDNNSCDLAPETVDEHALTNLAVATGIYQSPTGPPVSQSDSDALTVSAEDIAVAKSVNNSALEVGAKSTWSLHVRTSEYRTFTSTTIDDTLPDGYCPLDSSTNWDINAPINPECDGTGLPADDPVITRTSPPSSTVTPYSSAVENTDGTWSLGWNLGDIDRNDDFTLSFKSRTLHDYQENFLPSTPILSGDSATNLVDIEGLAQPICSSDIGGVVPCPGAPEIFWTEPPNTLNTDSSFATQTAGYPVLDKQARQITPLTDTVPVNCSTGTSTYSDAVAGTYHPGDVVCWKLHVHFPDLTSTAGVTLTDFLPIGTSYVTPGPTGSGRIAATDDFPGTTLTDNDTFVTFDLGTPTVSDGGYDFDWILPTRIDNIASNPLTVLPALRGNLLKMSTTDTLGRVTTRRDQADFTYAQPALTMLKGVRQINSGPILNPALDAQTVVGGDIVTYAIDITNATAIPAVQTAVHERVIGPYNCTMISVISDGGSCATTGSGATAITTITWDAADAITVPAQVGAVTGKKQLTWKFTVPSLVSPMVTIPDNACVDSYGNDTNVGDVYTTYALNPTATCGTPPVGVTPTGPPANDTSSVVAGGSIVKTRTTSVAETNNDVNTQATIGEEINYNVAITVPNNTTVTNGLVRDSLNAQISRQSFVAGSLTCSLTGSPDPCGTGALAGFTTDFSTPNAPLNNVQLTFPSTYTNTSGAAQVFNIIFKTKVVDIGTNVVGASALTNQATLTQTSQYNVTDTRNSGTVSTQIVEPNVAVAKTHTPVAASVGPNQQVQYDLTVTNPNRTGAPTPPASTISHNTVIKDVVPAGITPSNGAGVATPDGGTVVRCDGAAQVGTGTWDFLSHTITWNLGDVTPVSTTHLFYCATVDAASSGLQQLTNTATLTGTSMPGVVTGERTYTSIATDIVTVVGASLTKAITSPSPANATIGDDVNYTLTATIPQDVQFYDFKVTDVMPDGMNNFVNGTVTCSGDCTGFAAPTPTQVGQTLTWNFGDLASSNTANRVFTITYTTHVAAAKTSPAGPVVSGQPLTNTAHNSWNIVDNNPATVVNSPNQTANVSVVEPVLGISKVVRTTAPVVGADTDTRNAQPGESYLYTVVVTNSGNAPAYDIFADDQPPAGIVNVAPVAGVSTTLLTDPWTVGNPHMRWTIPTIAAGASVTLQYTADIAPSANLTNNQSLPNTAHVPSYWGVPSTERLLPANATVDYRNYTSDPADTVTQTVRLPQLAIAKTTGSGAESANAELDQPFTWRVTLSNTSTVATAYDVDFIDTLPAGWVYDTGSATFTPGASANPTSIVGQVLTWNTTADIAPGGNIVLTFTAHLPSTVLNGSNPSNPYINNASGTADDISGASGSFTGPYAAGPDPASANIQMPVLAIAKTPDLGAATAGTASSYSILITNSGSGTARNVVVTDAFPTGLNFSGPATATGAGVNFTTTSTTPNATNPTQIIWHFDSLPPNSTATITVPVFVPADTASATTFTNTASVHSNERPTDISDTGSLVVGTAANVNITKTDGGVTGTAGQNVSYTIQTTNAGPSIARNATMTDPIPAGTSFVSITPAAGNSADACDFGTTTAGTVTCVASAPMTVGSTRTYTLILKIDAGFTGATNAGTVTNVASVTATEMPGSNSAVETTPVVSSADIVVTKNVSSGSPSTILNHDETEFTMTVENQGPSDANAVSLADDLPAGLSCVSTTPTVGVTGCAGVPGELVTYALGTITSGTTVTVTITVRGEVVGTQINPAVGSSTTPLINPGDDSDSANVVVDPMADVAVTKTAPAVAASGDDLAYAITVTNNGPDPAANVILTDQLPPGVSILSVTPSSPSCAAPVGLLVTCNFGTMAAGATITIALDINVGFQYPNTVLSNTAVVASTTGDLFPANNTDTADTVVGPNADVSIIKSGPAYGAVAHQMVYTLAVQNSGPKTAQDVTVSDPLPAGVQFVSATSTVGTCAQTAGTVTCDLGDMVMSASAQIQIVIIPGETLSDTTITNTATVSSITPDPNLSNNTSTIQTPIKNSTFPESSDVTLTKTVPSEAVAIGDKVTFTLTASNSGPSPATNVVVTDTLPEGLFFVSGGGPGADCSAVGQIVTCNLGTIPADGSVSFPLVAVVMQTGFITNNASVTADNDRDPSNNSAVAPLAAGDSTAKLSLTKVANKKTALIGKTVNYKIVVKNVSQVTAVNVVVCDLVPKRLSVVKRGGGTLKGGNVCWTIPYLDPGKSQTFKLTMRILNGRGTSVTNPARATSTNAGTKRAKAKITVPGVANRGGGTTG